MSQQKGQFVRFLFLRLDPAWRRAPVAEQQVGKQELAEAVLAVRARLLLRTYSLVGTRGDADLLFWQAANDVESLQAFQTSLFSTRLGAYLHIAYSYFGITRRSIYDIPAEAGEPHLTVAPQDSRYLFVYPFVKTRGWYGLPLEQRQTMMDEHIRIGRKHAGIRINTIYSFGLDDQEFVVAFEADDPADFVSLVMELRESEASAHTLRDTPIFSCIQMSIWDALDSLGGGATGARAPERPEAGDGFVAVARSADLPPGSARRVYLGSHAIALFNVQGRVFAVSDRCTHGRASLSEGRVDAAANALHCPWHGGVFELETGKPCAGPPRAPLSTFEVKVDGDQILVR